jgi:hypothetical protein
MSALRGELELTYPSDAPRHAEDSPFRYNVGERRRTATSMLV